jgi:uncharacterized protein (DUF1499 family)
MTDQTILNVTPKRISKMIGWIALGITATIFGLIAWRIDDWGRDWSQNTAELTPNAERPELCPVELSTGVNETIQRIQDWTLSRSNWDVVSVDETTGDPAAPSASLKLTRTSPIMRFVDDVTVTINVNPDGDGVIVGGKSQSRIGKGDLGQNPRNLIELTRGLRGT